MNEFGESNSTKLCFNRFIEERGMSFHCQESTTIPIWTKNSNPAECSNYNLIRMLFYTMIIFGRILDSRIHDIVPISVNQTGLLKNSWRCSYHDWISDLEKTFYPVPHSFGKLMVPLEEFVHWIKSLRRDLKGKVRSVGVHQNRVFGD